MADMSREVSIPLDDGFLRRECPLCMREFKVALLPKEIEDLHQKVMNSFLVTDADEEETDLGEDEDEEMHFCPYCGQESPEGQWWTQEQLAYRKTIAGNRAADIINEEFIGPLKRAFGRGSRGPISIGFEADEIPHKEEWIAPETDDMTVVHLPCCDRRMKILDDWSETVHCFFCGFPHNDLKAPASE